jgi:hypothetical protein
MSLALTTTHENCYFQRSVSEGLWRHSKCFVSHGVGHPLLRLCDAEAPHCRQNKACKDLGPYSAWLKVADTVIKTACSLLRPSPASPHGASRGVRRLRCLGGSSGVPHVRAGP